MDKIFNIKPVFVDTIDTELEHGVLYVSMKYDLAIHLCACGCGVKSVTPLGKDGWKIEKDQSSTMVTLTPSIGNFNGEKPYHAHYFITNNKIEWV